MAQSKSLVVVFAFLALASVAFSHKIGGHGGHGGNGGGGYYLYPQFYDHSCPRAQEIVKSIVAKAFAKEARIAASLLRLHFHDCFVKVIASTKSLFFN